MNLERILEKPTTVNNVHESVYRSYDILECVLTMVSRGDSKDTILDVYALLISPNFSKETTIGCLNPIK